MPRQKWLEPLLEESFIPRLTSLTADDLATAQALSQELRDCWTAKGYEKITQHKDLMTRTRKYFSTVLPADHVAFRAIRLSADEYTQANRESQLRLQERNQEQIILSPLAVNGLVTLATQNLITSDHWQNVAAALALLTGRRHSELFFAIFEPATDYTIWASGLSKRKDDDPNTPLRIEIPTLCLAEYVLEAIARLRDATQPQGMTEAEISKKFGSPVSQASRDLFGKYLSNNDDLSTHTLRDCYSEIATYFYCPGTLSAHEYKAHLLGHYQATVAGEPRQRSIAANRNYDRFSIQDAGLIRKGIRLHRPGVTVLQIFNQQTQEPSMSIPEDLSRFPLVSASEAFHLARKRGWEKTRPSFKKYRVNHPEQLAQEYGLYLDPAILKTLKRGDSRTPTWRDLWANEKTTTPIPSPSPNPNPEAIATAPPQPAPTITPIPDPQPASQPTTLPTHQEANVTLELIDRIQTLSAENAKLQMENSQLKSGVAVQNNPELATELSQLREENSALRNQLEAIQAALSNVGMTLQIPSTPPTPTQPTEETPTEISEESTEKLPIVNPVYRAIQAIFEWNNTPGREHREKWPISFPVIMQLLRANNYGASQKSIKEWFDRLENEISAHYKHHGLSRTQARYHQDKITDCITLD